MTIAVTNISTLKTITADAKKLRFVESETAWFWSDPNSVENPDNINIIAPNSGVGRWKKMYSRPVSTNAYVWQVVTSAPTTIAASANNAFICNASTNNVITIELPSSPGVGTSIKVRKLNVTGWSNRVTIVRNGQLINSFADNYAISGQDTEVEFIFVGGTIGWHFITNRPIERESSVVSLNLVSSGDTNGLFYYIGTNKLATTTYTNPVIANLVSVFFAGSVAEQSSGTDRLSTTEYNTELSPANFILINIAKNTSRRFRLQTLSIQATNATASTTVAWRSFRIWGGNTVQAPNPSNPFHLSGYVNWEPVRTFIDDTTMPTTASAWTNYNINASSFYDCFKIQLIKNNNGNETIVQTQGTRFAEMEMYGDLIW